MTPQQALNLFSNNIIDAKQECFSVVLDKIDAH